MKVFLSGDTPKHHLEEGLQNLGHEVLLDEKMVFMVWKPRVERVFQRLKRPFFS